MAKLRRALRPIIEDIGFVPRLFAYGVCAVLALSLQPGFAAIPLLVWCVLGPPSLAWLRLRWASWVLVLVEVALVVTLTALAGLSALTLGAFVVTLTLGYLTLGGWRLGLAALAAACACLCMALGLGLPLRLQPSAVEVFGGVALPLLFAMLMSELAWRQSARLREARRRLADQARRDAALANRLARYLPPAVHQNTFAGDAPPVRSRRGWLTVCFGDLAGFTALTEGSESEEVVAMLNDFYAEMAQAALAHGGTLDKFIGDAVMVFFGDPVSAGRQGDARAALAMAAEMRRRFHALRRRWQASGVADALDLRIGLHSGWCTVGTFGHAERLDYTVIGATVNAASRLETAAQPGQILLSRTTWQLLGEQATRCRRVPPVVAKGLQAPIEAFELPTEVPPAPVELGCDGLSLRLQPDCLDIGDARALLHEVCTWLETRQAS